MDVNVAERGTQTLKITYVLFHIVPEHSYNYYHLRSVRGFIFHSLQQSSDVSIC